MNFGQKLKKLRLKSGLTQGDLAKEIGITERSIYNYERNNKVPKIETCKKVADYFNISVEKLTNDSDLYEEQNLFSYEEDLKNQRELDDILSKTTAVFSGGKLSQEDKDKFFEAMTKAYFMAKEKERKNNRG